MDCDILIVGGGAAGCTAGSRLARKYKVCIVNVRTSATAMSAGRIQITDPENEHSSELSKFLENIGKEYGLFTKQEETASLTNRGTEYRQSFVSDHDYSGGNAAAAGIKENSDLNPELFSRIAGSYGLKISPYMIEGDLETGLQEIPEDIVIIPPIYGLKQYRDLKDLERKCGRMVKEAATPLSLPGKRFSECLLASAEDAGAEILQGREAIEINNGSAVLASGLRETAVTYSALLLAGGNAISGGLQLDGNMVREPLLNLPISENSDIGLKSAALTSALSAGIKSPKASFGVYACGSILSGISYPLNKGLWDVMLSALDAAEAVEDDLQ